MAKPATLTHRRLIIAVTVVVLVAGFAITWKPKPVTAPVTWRPPQISLSGTARLTDAGQLGGDPTITEFRALPGGSRFGESLSGQVAVVELQWSSPGFPAEASACDLDVYVVAPAGWQWAHWAGDQEVSNGNGESDLYFANDRRFAHKDPLVLFTPSRGSGKIATIAMIPDPASGGNIVVETYMSLYCNNMEPRGTIFDGPKIALRM